MRVVSLNTDSRLRSHRIQGKRCAGSGITLDGLIIDGDVLHDSPEEARMQQALRDGRRVYITGKVEIPVRGPE